MLYLFTFFSLQKFQESKAIHRKYYDYQKLGVLRERERLPVLLKDCSASVSLKFVISGECWSSSPSLPITAVSLFVAYKKLDGNWDSSLKTTHFLPSFLSGPPGCQMVTLIWARVAIKSTNSTGEKNMPANPHYKNPSMQICLRLYLTVVHSRMHSGSL